MIIILCKTLLRGEGRNVAGEGLLAAIEYVASLAGKPGSHLGIVLWRAGRKVTEIPFLSSPLRPSKIMF